MAPVVPDPGKIRSFRTEAAFAVCMKANHALARGDTIVPERRDPSRARTSRR